MEDIIFKVIYLKRDLEKSEFIKEIRRPLFSGRMSTFLKGEL